MKNSFLLITTAALLAACSGNKADTGESTETGTTETEAAVVKDTPAIAAAKANDAKSIVGFNPDELKFEEIIADAHVGEVVNGKEVSIIVVPTAAVDANFNAFNMALFDKIKATAGRVGNDTKEELNAPYETTGGMSLWVYSYSIDGHEVYCSVSNTGGQSGKDYELIFTKY